MNTSRAFTFSLNLTFGQFVYQFSAIWPSIVVHCRFSPSLNLSTGAAVLVSRVGVRFQAQMRFPHKPRIFERFSPLSACPTAIGATRCSEYMSEIRTVIESLPWDERTQWYTIDNYIMLLLMASTVTGIELTGLKFIQLKKEYLNYAKS